MLPPSKWRFLRFLSLTDNAMTEISVESLAPIAANLNFLDLSRNQFTNIPAALATLSALRSLDMSNNHIESLHSLLQHPVPGISTLNLRANKLKTIAGIDRLPSLERVDLRDNLLKDPMEMARLNGAPNFTEMYVTGNPFTRTYYDYRVAIFNIFRTNPDMTEDISLDGKKPGMLEKRSLEPRATEQLPPPKSLAIADDIARSPAASVMQKENSISASLDLAGEEHNIKPKKKSHKSRVIDLAAAPQAPVEQSSPSRSPESVKQSPGKGDRVSKAENEWASGEDYRKRIEALKQEVGSGWIRVINEESFKNQHKVAPG